MLSSIFTFVLLNSAAGASIPSVSNGTDLYNSVTSTQYTLTVPASTPPNGDLPLVVVATDVLEDETNTSMVVDESDSGAENDTMWHTDGSGTAGDNDDTA